MFSPLQTLGHLGHQALKARAIPAWGKAPCQQTHRTKRDEGPTYRIATISLVAAMVVCFVVVGCSRHIDKKMIPTPVPGLFFTEEIYRGQGAIDNDFTNLYLNFERNGKADKRLVLSGTYVELNQVVWTGLSEAKLCMQAGGLTDQFRSVVTLNAKDAYQSIHFLLREDC